MKHSVRAEAHKPIPGPMGILSVQYDEIRLICIEWEGIAAVEEENDR